MRIYLNLLKVMIIDAYIRKPIIENNFTIVFKNYFNVGIFLNMNGFNFKAVM